MSVRSENLHTARSSAVSVISPAPRDKWRQIYSADPLSLVSQTSEWIDTISSVDGSTDASRYYQTEDGQEMILPLVRYQVFGGTITTAASFSNSWGMGGPISSRPLRETDLQAVLDDLSTQPDLMRHIRPNPLLNKVWESVKPTGAVVTPRVAHVLDLDGGFQYVWEKCFRSTTRTAIRKAEKSGLTVECDSEGKLLPLFYQLFDLSLDRWAQKQHEPAALTRFRGHRRDPIEKFQKMVEHLGGSFQIWAAWHQGTPAAAIIVLMGQNANYTRGAMDIQVAGPVRANDLLHKLAIEEACRAGCRYYHMGETGDSNSLAAFKEGFGARPVPYAEYTFERLPISRVNRAVRGAVKRVIGFKDA